MVVSYADTRTSSSRAERWRPPHITGADIVSSEEKIDLLYIRDVYNYMENFLTILDPSSRISQSFATLSFIRPRSRADYYVRRLLLPAIPSLLALLRPMSKFASDHPH